MLFPLFLPTLMSTTMSDTVTSDNGVPHTSVGKKPGEPHVIKVQPLKRSEMQVRVPVSE